MYVASTTRMLSLLLSKSNINTLLFGCMSLAVFVVAMSGQQQNERVLVVGTRIHLGKSSALVEIDQNEYNRKVYNFARFCTYSCRRSAAAVIAVDAAGANGKLYTAIQNACTFSNQKLQDELSNNNNNESTDGMIVPTPLHVLPVQPWGQFTPALNSIISWSLTNVENIDELLFVSLEADASPESISMLRSHLWSSSSSLPPDNNDDNVLVAGACLPGHQYCNQHDDNAKECTINELNGLTSPWNTLAIWNVRKLALTGFQLVSEGLLSPTKRHEDIAGIEEVVTIALLQKILGPENAMAKLVRVPGIGWEQNFSNDVERQKWHDTKMKSKLSRSLQQLQMFYHDKLLGGVVYHC